MNNITIIQVDRTFLYLVAIYVIHGVLLHLLLMYPQRDGAKFNWSIVSLGISNSSDGSIVKRDSYDCETVKLNISIELTDRMTRWRNIDCDNNHVHRDIIITSELSYQTKFPGTANCYSMLSETEISIIKMISFGSKMLKNMSPAALGIILGCMVFLFTDNINIS